MVKQRIAFLLGLVWLFNFTAIFSAPKQTNLDELRLEKIGTLQEVITPSIQLLLTSEKPITPTFAIDWGLWSNFNSPWVPIQLLTKDLSLSIPLFKKSLPLFDVKETFIHFFHTW